MIELFIKNTLKAPSYSQDTQPTDYHGLLNSHTSWACGDAGLGISRLVTFCLVIKGKLAHNSNDDLGNPPNLQKGIPTSKTFIIE